MIVGGLGAANGRGVRMVIPLLFLPFSSNLPEAPGTRHGGEIEQAGEKNKSHNAHIRPRWVLRVYRVPRVIERIVLQTPLLPTYLT